MDNYASGYLVGSHLLNQMDKKPHVLYVPMCLTPSEIYEQRYAVMQILDDHPRFDDAVSFVKMQYDRGILGHLYGTDTREQCIVRAQWWYVNRKSKEECIKLIQTVELMLRLPTDLWTRTMSGEPCVYGNALYRKPDQALDVTTVITQRLPLSPRAASVVSDAPTECAHYRVIGATDTQPASAEESEEDETADEEEEEGEEDEDDESVVSGVGVEYEYCPLMMRMVRVYVFQGNGN